jgi:hypothetical protein
VVFRPQVSYLGVLVDQRSQEQQNGGEGGGFFSLALRVWKQLGRIPFFRVVVALFRWLVGFVRVGTPFAYDGSQSVAQLSVCGLCVRDVRNGDSYVVELHFHKTS